MGSELPTLRVEDVSKRFGVTLALDHVTLESRRGEVLALLGQNGAGKSTLIKILGGVFPPDQGRVMIEDRQLAADPRDAQRRGIAVIYQDLALYPNLTVAENIAGDFQTSFGYSRKAALELARRALARTGASLPLERQASSLSAGAQQLVAIARALARDANVLVLDEPTASLGSSDAEHLLAVVREIASTGCAIIFVSHRLREVRQIANRFAVLRDGRLAFTAAARGTSDAQLFTAMFGDSADKATAVNGSSRAPDEAHAVASSPIFKAVACSRTREFQDISFSLQVGELTVVTGLIGSGRTEFAQAAFGLRNFDSGYVEINGNRLPLANPAAALEAGLVYVPEDRLLEGLFPALSIADNLSVTRMRETATLGVTRPLGSFVTEQIRRFSIKTAGAAAPVATLSGGNQQKVLLAKWLAKRPTVLIADEPTAGIDVLTRAEIHDRLRQLARSDVAVLAICSDLDEALELADRVMVFHRGRIVLDQPRTAVNRESIMSAMMGTEGAV